MTEVEIARLNDGGRVLADAGKNDFLLMIETGGLHAERCVICLTQLESVSKLREQCDLWLTTQ